MRVITSSLLALCLGGGVAAASPFVTLDRQDDTSSVGGELLYTFTDFNNQDVTLIRLDGHFQYILDSGIGIYGVLPLAYGSDDNDSYTAIGDIEVGGIYNVRANADWLVALHGGLMLPTSGDDPADATIGGYASYYRVQDSYQFIPEGTTLRLAASPIYQKGKLFLRGDLGFDLNLDNSYDNNADNALHLDVGVGGWVSPNFSLAGELTSLTTFNDRDNDDDNDTNIAVTGRYHTGSNLQLYFGLAADSDTRDNLPAGIVLGIDAPLR
jgi:hypothetical protein